MSEIFDSHDGEILRRRSFLDCRFPFLSFRVRTFAVEPIRKNKMCFPFHNSGGASK